VCGMVVLLWPVHWSCLERTSHLLTPVCQSTSDKPTCPAVCLLPPSTHSHSTTPPPTPPPSISWSCARGGQSYGQPCGIALTTTTAEATIYANSLGVGVYIFTVQVADSLTGRTAAASVTITTQSYGTSKAHTHIYL
jgi:hypothetical protein